MIAINMSVRGGRQLRELLKKLEGPEHVQVLRTASRKAAKDLHRGIKPLVPVDRGLLKKKLKVRAIATKIQRRFGIVGHNVITPTREELKIPKDAKGYYPFSIEYGFRHVSGKIIPPHSYMRAGFDATEMQAYNTFKHEVGAGIDRIVGKSTLL